MNKYLIRCLIMTILVIVALYNFYIISYIKGDRYEINFLPVGNGDAVVITKSLQPIVIIDGGPDYFIDYYLSRFFIFSNCRLLAIFLTHPHLDHLKGLTRILDHCFVENVIENSSDFKSSLYDYWKNLFLLKNSEYLNLVNKRTTYLKSFYSGDVFLAKDLKLISLYPTKDRHKYLERNLKQANDISLVLLLDYHDFEALFMGDLEMENHEFIDTAILDKYVDGHIEVLKVPHHGAKNGYNPTFFDKYTFDTAIVCTGPNKYGHPDKSVIDYFSNRGTKVLRTDKSGVIKIPLP